ncbi:hypothetical protein ABVF61_15215 [Roseibium sp. HPY-6]|uniref:hypothetical protein n=1 Tax=Roseibium sp. HPY-6 TaxID=3229852 RepID=UPI00338F9BAF
MRIGTRDRCAECADHFHDVVCLGHLLILAGRSEWDPTPKRVIDLFEDVKPKLRILSDYFYGTLWVPKSGVLVPEMANGVQQDISTRVKGPIYRRIYAS